MAEAGEIFDYWRRHPPTFQLVGVIAQMLGWKPHAPPAPELRLSRADLTDLEAQSRDIGFPVPIFDLEALREKNDRLREEKRTLH